MTIMYPMNPVDALQPGFWQVGFDAMTPCPTEEELAGYRLGVCEAPDVARIEAHIAACDTCRAWCDAVDSDDDLLPDVRNALDAEQRDHEKTLIVASASAHGAERVEPAAPRIEGYAIIREIGRGGMGAVYLARQESTKREVALKVLLEGPFASTTAKRRFEREVELAAQLDHPNIVTILDSGIASGRYYCAMRNIVGRRLDRYIAGHQLSPDQILTLFLKICRAVNHAHQKGVIHRDLKPSNILVDDNGEPYILDFGLAKPAEGSTLSDVEQTALSMPGQVMGTLPYMSPEQTTGRQQDVDVRSDVYSLGVILYQLLTGRFPYQVVGKLAEVLRNIVEVAPERPSTIRRNINNEIETIVLTALAKEPVRRYQTADAFGGDIQRYLGGEPIEAKRDSGWYVLRKTATQHRAPLSVAAAIVLILTIGIFGVLKRRDQRAHASADAILAGFVSNPVTALASALGATGAVKTYLHDGIDRYLRSDAYTDRVKAARAGIWLDQQGFWESVDGGPLWKNGEWLELAKINWPDTDAFVDELVDVAQTGTCRQRYVALCLLGWTAAHDPRTVEAAQANKAAGASPGVWAAADWALRRGGNGAGDAAGIAPTDGVVVDPVSTLTFVRIPAADAFLPGSDPSDPDRRANEDHPGEPVGIDSILVSNTEVTLASFAAFFETHKNDATVFGDAAANRRAWEMTGGIVRAIEWKGAHPSERIACGWISRNAAGAFCDWLERQAAQQGLHRRYRLLTENEWEYACRGGNSGRFCFGNDERYVPFFGRVNGETVEFHTVAQRMPNWYGLFDMHGGLWETCATRFPADQVPTKAHKSLTLFAKRGGAYYSPAVRCRSAQRNYTTPDAEDPYGGIRLVMEIVE